MCRKIKSLVDLPADQEFLEGLCMEKGLNDYETELILRIYWKKQKFKEIAEYMDFMGHGKTRHSYSIRTLNNFHKEAIYKIIEEDF